MGESAENDVFDPLRHFVTIVCCAAQRGPKW
jgi:hypothetical protein